MNTLGCTRFVPLACALVLCLVALLPWSAAAQSETASAIGTIRDAQGGAMPGVSLTLRNVDMGLARQSTTSDEGRYWLAGLPAGRYELTAERAGFRTVVRAGITLTLGAEAVLDVDLSVAGVGETITVAADAPVVATTTSAIEMRLNRVQLDLLPLFGRDYLSLLRLTPASQAFGSSFTGSRERSNEFTLDGVDNTSDIAGFQRTGVTLDSIQEVQVLANNYKAEHGRASGGVINVVTRSGSNRRSGSALLAVSDDAFNAQSPYANRRVPEPPYRLLTVGGTSGGPLVRDRWHHFVAYERADQDSQLEATQVMPASTAPFSPATLAFLMANSISPSVFGAGGLVRQVRPDYVTNHSLTARVDGQAGNAQTAGLRYTFRRSARSPGTQGTLFDYNGDRTLVRDHYLVASHKWTLGASRLNEAYVHGGHTLSDFRVAYPALTNVIVSGGFSLGGNSGYPQGRDEPMLQFADAYTVTRRSERWGEHTVKAGANLKIFRSRSFFDADSRGTFVFFSLQQFIQGQPSTFTQFRGDTSLDRPNTLTGVYVQDDWRPRPDLTINAGLRYDYESAKTEALREVSGQPGPGIGRDRNNVAPRVGAVWAPGGSTKHAVHAGAGLFYDQIVLNILGNVRFTPPKVIGIAIANPSFPDATSGLLTTPAPAISTIDPDLTTPYNLNSSLGYRRELTPSLGLDVSVVHNRGWNQVMTVDRNAGIPGTANVFGQGAAGRAQAITGDTFSTNLGVIRYTGLLVDVRKRFSHGVQGGLAYTLSKTVDNGFSFATAIQVPERPDLNLGPGANDRRHELKGHAEIELPFDLQLAAIVEHYGEAPLNVTALRDVNGDGLTGDWVHESICRTVSCPGFQYSRNSVKELSTEEANRLRALFGLAPIAAFANNPKYLNVNMTLQKSVRFGGRRARVTAEAFNLLNTPQRLIGSTSATSGIFGTYVAVVQPRAVQLTVQVDW
jgi:hypothetical protein